MPKLRMAVDGGSRVGVEGIGDFDLGIESLDEVELGVEEAGVPPLTQMTGAVAVKWEPLHIAILEAEIEWSQAGGVNENQNVFMAALARRLKSTVEELGDIKAQIPEDEWEDERLRKTLVVEARKGGIRAGNWDEIEKLAQEKILALMAQNKLKTVGEWMAAAQLANRAVRRGTAVRDDPGDRANPVGGGGPAIGITIQQQNNGGLPGAGSLGTIQLSLSQTTVDQLGKPHVIEGERVLDTMDMLLPSDIKELNTLSESEDT